MRLVLATGNAGKLKELRELLAPPAFEVLPQSQFTPSERRGNRSEFRRERASSRPGMPRTPPGSPAIADDSGLGSGCARRRAGHSTRLVTPVSMPSDEENLRKLLGGAAMANRLRNALRATNARWCSYARRWIHRR